MVAVIFATFIPLCAMLFFIYKFAKERKRANKLEVQVEYLQNDAYRRAEESMEQKYDIKILITKDPSHNKHKDVVKKWTEKFHKRDNFIWVENPYKS